MGEAKPDTFVVDRTERILRQVRWLSFYHLVPEKHLTFFFADCWALGWLAGSLVCYIVSLWITNFGVASVIGVLSAIRVFECVTYLCNVTFFPKPNKGEHGLRSYRRTVILLMANYLEIILWFATWYALLRLQGQLKVDGPVSFAILRESLAFMVANSTNGIQAMTRFALFVVTVQNFVGLFMTVVIVTRFVSLLPRPTSGDAEERE